MTSRSRVIAVIATTCAVVLAFALLSITAWHPEKESWPANSALGITAEFDGDKSSPVSDFYTPPTPLPPVADGTVLKSEPIAEAPQGVKAWRIMYASRDNDNKPIAITAYYAEPDRVTTDGFPLVALAHGTTGLSPECGMSEAPFTEGTTGWEYWNFLGRQMVASGFAVVATDYEGMGAPGKATYLLRKQGYDLLDSIRAAIHLRPNTVDATNVGMMGHSEGGYVVLAATDMLTSYAPDLMVRGTVSIAPGGVPPIPFAVKALVASTGDSGASPRNGYVTFLSQSWSQTYPDLLPPESWYTAEGLQKIPPASKLCQGQVMKDLTGPITEYFRTDLPPAVITVAAQNAPITTKTTVPTLFIQGAKDTGVVPQVTRGFATQMCHFGSTVDYVQFPGDTHRSSVFSSVPEWTDWLNARFAGQPAASSCGGL